MGSFSLNMGESPLGPDVPLERHALDAVMVLAPAVGASGLGEVGLRRDPWFTLARALVRLVGVLCVRPWLATDVALRDGPRGIILYRPRVGAGRREWNVTAGARVFGLVYLALTLGRLVWVGYPPPLMLAGLMRLVR